MFGPDTVYQHRLALTNLNYGGSNMAIQTICEVEGCGKTSRARGWCVSHYKRWKRHGNALLGGTPMGARLKWIQENKHYSGSDCLIWPYSTNENGYGQFKVSGKSTIASREMCRAAHGNPPSEDWQAAHSCGKGHMGCTNPLHLRWATMSENESDKVPHGTIVHGSNHHASKLTPVDVLGMRSMAKSKSQKMIAEEFGVSRQQVGKILRNEQWTRLE